MLDENSNKLQAINPQYLLVHDQTDTTQSIDFFDLLSVLFKKRALIAVITGLCTLCAILITFLLPKTYEAKSNLVEPYPNQFQKLILNADLNAQGPVLFNKFIKLLSKKSNIISFLRENNLVIPEDQKARLSKEKLSHLLNVASKHFQVVVINHFKGDMKDSFNDNGKEAELVTFFPTLDLQATANKAYLAYTNQKALQKLISAQREIIQSKITKLTEQIQIRIATVTANRGNEIKQLIDKQNLSIAQLNNSIEALTKRDERDRQIRLQELEQALQIAQLLGITYPNQVQKLKSQNIVVDVNQNHNDLYLKGTTYLKKEIALLKATPHTLDYNKKISALQEKLHLVQNDKKIIALRERKDDRPYTKNIEQLQAELKRLKTLSFDVNGVNLFAMDGQPLVDSKPIKPKKGLIIVLGLILGFLLSCMIVLFQDAMHKRNSMVLPS
ncbi:Wzz/FepE/Etk N-terminal domain-containing protein [Fluoribacter gormanii]|uniref:Ferric enterobactin transport protein fepE n=1 Tax=Fluoribacter gormanii TaxID=464 RepID=A0A377GF09_9GAMM|nr:Wzz/FepE/Etk N-terminal domain-containing protein [Fluoribacter gormanii]KTD04605.1 Ferric enterobactin transport protein FepE [Fluoribacter gormanii]MCW8445045.1 Wzz/FepE/Etk N-terminal domain-containing protein [Fluoribacter gormanii]MCW8470255.1 Wzz/FepE/Etk N-terminal domain-containing protein [Fluoribacter gormanii]SIR33348.1 LPS O-antigen chain length determinant protein, WzzB/FepE family [Fluoribacter gormanii]STO23389.1 Ferric enterobactin transport protein fepE [Fluoribacter gorman